MDIIANKQRGAVILENLIAILVFSMGILGLVGLLVASVSSTASARYRTDASLLANRIIGEMWADNKNNTVLKTNFQSPSGAKFVAWKTAVGNTLPGVEANPPTVAIDMNNLATITVRWKAPDDKAAHSFVVLARIIP